MKNNYDLYLDKTSDALKSAFEISTGQDLLKANRQWERAQRNKHNINLGLVVTLGFLYVTILGMIPVMQSFGYRDQIWSVLLMTCVICVCSGAFLWRARKTCDAVIDSNEWILEGFKKAVDDVQPEGQVFGESSPDLTEHQIEKNLIQIAKVKVRAESYMDSLERDDCLCEPEIRSATKELSLASLKFDRAYASATLVFGMTYSRRYIFQYTPRN